MKIYIEYVILDNLIINLVIILLTGLVLSKKYDFMRILTADLFGTACAIALPYLKVSIFVLIPFKLFVGLLMTSLFKKYANYKEYLVTFIVFLSMTFLMGGVCYAVNQMFGLKVVGGQLIITNYSLPVSMFCAVAGVYFYLLFWLIKYLKHRNSLNNYYFDVEIKIDKKVHFLRGYLDTGNKLTDGGKSVVLVPMKTFLKEFKDYPLEKLCCNPKYMLVKAVSGFDKMQVVDAEEILIKNSEKVITMQNIKIGLSKANFSSDFDCLLNAEMLKGWKGENT